MRSLNSVILPYERLNAISVNVDDERVNSKTPRAYGPAVSRNYRLFDTSTRVVVNVFFPSEKTRSEFENRPGRSKNPQLSTIRGERGGGNVGRRYFY